MNLNNSPSIDQLKYLFASADDDAGNHVLWVSQSADVLLSAIPYSLTPVGFERSQASMRMRYETFDRGNDYVGAAAASDEEFMARLFASLVAEWETCGTSAHVKYVDSY